MSKKVKPGLRAQLVAAIQAAHLTSGQGDVTIAHITCYRGYLVAKAMGDGGCTGYYWRDPRMPAWDTDAVFWADSFDDAFRDVDQMIDMAQGKPVTLRYAGDDDFDPTPRHDGIV
jgi:hypothetical protein